MAALKKNKRWPQRAWINQPSTLQPLHARHGEKVLVVWEYDDTFNAFLLQGPTISEQMLGIWLTAGWRDE